MQKTVFMIGRSTGNNTKVTIKSQIKGGNPEDKWNGYNIQCISYEAYFFISGMSCLIAFIILPFLYHVLCMFI